MSGAPAVRRDEMLRDQLAHPPYGSRRRGGPPPVRVGITGTGADLLVLAWTAEDLARERAAGARLLAALGVRAGMRVANTLPGALATPGSLLLGDVVEELGALDVPLGHVTGEAAARQAWELIDRVRPDVLVLDPPSARALFAAAPRAERPWWGGIVWLHAGAGPAPARAAVPAEAGFAGWQRTWLALPEATSFVAHECAAGWLHAEPHVTVDVTDGTLVIGTGDERYQSALAARAVADCTCGEEGTALEVT